MIERDPEECVGAAVDQDDAGYRVTLERADGARVPIACESADAAANLLRLMNPPSDAVAIRLPRGDARDALLLAMGEELPARTLH